MNMELAMYVGSFCVVIGAVGLLPFHPEFKNSNEKYNIPLCIVGIAWFILWATPPLAKLWLFMLKAL